MDIRQTLINLAIEEFRCPADQLSETAPIRDLGIDSLGLVEFAFRIEEIFNVRIDNDELEKLITLADMVRLVERLTLPAAA